MPRRNPPPRRKLPPWSRHHETWCAIFRGKSCDCDDDLPPGRRRLPLPSADLFGLHAPPEQPHPSYSRLSRYDATGLCWLSQGKEVIALTADTATIRNPATGSLTTYRRFNKPALGPLGDSLEDFK